MTRVLYTVPVSIYGEVYIMSASYYAGLVVGVIAAVVVCFLYAKFIKRRGKNAGYDERQEAVRGRAYKWAFVVLVAYLAVYAWLEEVAELRWCETGAGLLVGVLLSATVFMVICIYKDAYFSVSDRPRAFVIAFGVLAAANICCGIAIRLWKLPDIYSGEGSFLLSFDDVNLVVGAYLLVIWVNILVKLRLDRRETE